MTRPIPIDTDLQNLITRFKDFPTLVRKPSFLEIAGCPHRETVWRNIFAFFFNPNESHGLKDLFLRSFFNAIGKEDHNTGDFDSMTVRTECQTSKGNYLDLLIWCHEFAIGIEMKVNAPLYNDLDDYALLVKAKNPTNEHRVVLSIAPCPEYGGFVNLRYTDLIPAIKQQLGNYLLAADPTYSAFLLDFLNHVTHYIGGYAMDIDPKQLQFMKDNYETVKRLISVHNQIQEDMNGRLLAIHESVKSLDSLKNLLNKDWPPFNIGTDRLIKFYFVSSGVGFFYQIWVDKYTHKSCFWINPDQPANEYLRYQLEDQGLGNEVFDVNQQIQEIVNAVEKTISSIARHIDQTVNQISPGIRQPR